jgi:hypothetical protein
MMAPEQNISSFCLIASKIVRLAEKSTLDIKYMFHASLHFIHAFCSVKYVTTKAPGDCGTLSSESGIADVVSWLRRDKLKQVIVANSKNAVSSVT